MRLALTRVFAATIALAGCAGADPGDETDDAAIDGKADSTRLRFGTYGLSPDVFMTFWTLDLDNSYQYHLRGGRGCTDRSDLATCDAIVEDHGTYRLTKSGWTKFLSLYDDLQTGAILVRFRYKVNSQGATLTDTSDQSSYSATFAADH
jgi:hypothetical protein